MPSNQLAYKVYISMDYCHRDRAISLSNIMILGRLGRGTTSHVFRVQYTKAKRPYAMKVIDKKDRSYSKQTFQRQIEVQRSLSHANIVQLIGHIEDEDNHYVLTQYCQGGEITKLIMEDIDERKIKNIVSQIDRGLNYMHGKGIAHCDLKLSNLLIHQQQIKICDFGFSRFINTVKPQSQQHLYGTLFYLAPEIIQNNQRTYFQQADIWAFGIILLIIVTKRQPYTAKTFKEIQQQILLGQRTKIPEDISPLLKKLIQSMLQHDHMKRITLQEILSHQFLSDTPQVNAKIQQTCIQPEKERKSTQWQFKRKTNSKTQEIDQTKQKIYKIADRSQDNDKTVKNCNKNDNRIQKQIRVEREQQQDINQSDGKQTNKKGLHPIEGRLIRPLGQFKYETKHDGYIKITKNGDIEVKVKNIFYSIIQRGNVLVCQKGEYSLSQLKDEGKNKIKKIYELYQYAFEVIDIIKKKNFYETFIQNIEYKQLIFGFNRKLSKAIVLTSLNKKKMTMQYTKDTDILHVRFEGQKVNEMKVNEIQCGQMQGLFDWLKQKLYLLVE